MSISILRRIATLAIVLFLAATNLFADTGDPGNTGDPATVPDTVIADADFAAIEAPPSLFSALSEWSGDRTTLALYVVENRPDVTRGYINEIERALGPLGEQLETSFPDTTTEYRELTGQEPSDDAIAFFAFIAGRPEVFDLWQQGLEATGLTLATFVSRHHREVDAELQAANRSPADEGVTLIDFLVEQGYDDLLGAAQGMVYKYGDMPPGTCGCSIVYDFTANPVEWKETANKVDYDGAPLPIIDKRYYAENDGAAGMHRLTRRTKAANEDYLEKEMDHYTEMMVKMHCFEGSNPQGATCQTGGCTAVLATKIIYGARSSIYIDAGFGSHGESRVAAYNQGRLLYKAGNAPQQVLMNQGFGIWGTEGINWNGHAFISSHLGWPIAVMNDEQEGNSADLLLEEEFVGIMFKETDYELKLNPWTLLYGWGKGLFENKTYAYSNTSFLMTGAVHGYTCDTHVTPPDNLLFWRYAAAPDAPYDTGYFRDQIEAFSNSHLNAVPPNLSDDSETSAEGSYAW